MRVIIVLHHDEVCRVFLEDSPETLEKVRAWAEEHPHPYVYRLVVAEVDEII